MLSEAQKRARNKWDSDNMAIISCKVKRELSDAFKDAAYANGTTPNAIIRECMEDYVANHRN